MKRVIELGNLMIWNTDQSFGFAWKRIVKFERQFSPYTTR